MSLPNLDVTALFPFPGELAARPIDTLRASAGTEAIGAAGGATSRTPNPEQSVAEPSAETLAGHIQQLNIELQNFGIEFEFSDTDNRLITRVVDRESGELIRQIPSEEVLRMARNLSETSGLLLQTQA